jgi:hypothetical protein
MRAGLSRTYFDQWKIIVGRLMVSLAFPSWFNGETRTEHDRREHGQ